MIQELQFELRGQSLVITFNRPANANAMTADMAGALFNRLKLATSDKGIRAIMLRGAGGNFMSGLEMGMYAGNFDVGVANANQMMQHYHSAIREMQVMEKPILAAVDGLVGGCGMSFMLASDFVLAGSGTKFNCGFTANALTPDGGASHFLARKAGALKANELLMLSDDFSAADAERWNLVNAVVDDAKLQEEALAWLDKLAAGPTRAFAGVKRLVQKAFEQDLNTHMALEHSHWGASTRTFDFREAVKARGEKRPPKFSGA